MSFEVKRWDFAKAKSIVDVKRKCLKRKAWGDHQYCFYSGVEDGSSGRWMLASRSIMPLFGNEEFCFHIMFPWGCELGEYEWEKANDYEICDFPEGLIEEYEKRLGRKRLISAEESDEEFENLLRGDSMKKDQS